MMTNEKLSINTVEGWAKFARETNTKSFISEMGREPHSYEEVTAWVSGCVEAANALCDPDPVNKYDATLRTVNGVRYWVTTF